MKGSIEPIDFYTYDVPQSEATSVDEVEADPDTNFFEQFAPATTASYRREFASAYSLQISIYSFIYVYPSIYSRDATFFFQNRLVLGWKLDRCSNCFGALFGSMAR